MTIEDETHLVTMWDNVDGVEWIARPARLRTTFGSLGGLREEVIVIRKEACWLDSVCNASGRFSDDAHFAATRGLCRSINALIECVCIAFSRYKVSESIVSEEDTERTDQMNSFRMRVIGTRPYL